MVRLGLRAKFLLGIFCVVILLGTAVIYFVKTSLRDNLQAALQQRGLISARHIAGASLSPVLTEQFFQLELLLRDLKSSEEDIRYIFLVDPQGAVLAATFDAGVPKGLKEANQTVPGTGYSIRRLATESEEVLDIAMPLMDGSLGFVRLGLSGESVKKEVDEFINLIVRINVAVLIMILVLAAFFDTIITKPVIALAEIANAVGRGDLERRANFHATDEIGLLAKAFDNMIEKRSTAEREKENLIAELRKALDEIKRLEGLLPICSACKKIRDDNGVWNHIESFISERSAADFTHSICPDCVKKIYPEYPEFHRKDS